MKHSHNGSLGGSAPELFENVFLFCLHQHSIYRIGILSDNKILSLLGLNHMNLILLVEKEGVVVVSSYNSSY